MSALMNSAGQQAKCIWMVLAPKLSLHAPMTGTSPRERPAYSEGLPSCVASRETGNYIKPVSTEQFVNFFRLEYQK